MVLIRLLDCVVLAETFAFGIVVMVDAVAAPVRLTFYAEVVVRLARQCAVAAVGFEYALCERMLAGMP